MEQKGQTEKQIIESLSPIEKRILPVLSSKTESIDEITIKYIGKKCIVKIRGNKSEKVFKDKKKYNRKKKYKNTIDV